MDFMLAFFNFYSKKTKVPIGFEEQSTSIG